MVNLTELNEDQRKAAEHINGPVRILAGAGSGKTRTITYRIAHMIDSGIAPSSILAITFTNKAAKEMKERTLQLLDTQVDGVPTLSTFHSFGVSIMRRTGTLLGYRTGTQICDADDATKRIKNICKAQGIDNKEINQYIEYISGAKDSLLMPEDIKPNTVFGINQKALKIYTLYQQELFTDNLLDFDDLIMQPVRIFMNYPKVLEHYQDKYRYITVDEYQDTSHAQAVMVKLLAAKYRNICIVGDDYQNIYSWRGADITNILNFDKEYPDAFCITIGQNYRSTQTIVNGAAAVIKYNTNQLDKQLMSMQDEGDPIYIHQANTDRDEAYFVMHQITTAINRGAKPEDFAILYRKNAYSRIFEDTLMYMHVPYQIFGGLSYYQRAEVKDILAYLKVINTYAIKDTKGVDRIAFKRIINLPKRGIGNAKIDQIEQMAQEQDILSVTMTAPEFDKVKGIVEFRELIQELADELENEKLSDFIRRLIMSIGYLDYLKENVKPNEDPKTLIDKTENVLELCSKAYEYEKINPTLSSVELLTLFLNDIALLTDQDTTASASAVSLMTMHRAKGLEFPYVFVVGCEEDCFPHSDPALGNTSEVQEDRRLCYVAMTRAKKKLYMTYCNSRNVYGNYCDRTPSRYLSEIPQMYIHEL